MRRAMLTAKLHGIRVTGAELHYEGSIALDPEHCDRIGLLPLQFVDIWNKTTGARISTYVIHGEPGSCCCILNGAAARTCQVGDELIIAAQAEISDEDLPDHKARVLIFEQHNRPAHLIEYALEHSGSTGGWRAVRIPAVAELRNGRAYMDAHS
jgi:aspartate 1-decarboxylase